jgi:hypothetical protein
MTIQEMKQVHDVLQFMLIVGLCSLCGVISAAMLVKALVELIAGYIKESEAPRKSRRIP